MKSVVLTTCVMLAACSMLPTSFDNVEYNNFVVAKQQAQRVEQACNSLYTKQEIDVLVNDVDHATLYVINTNEDPTLQQSSKVFKSMVDELSSAYQNGKNPGTAYCGFKLQIINQNIDIILTTIGSRKR